MAQISFSFSGGFWPISLPLFHGTSRPSALGAVLVAAYMNGSLVVGEEPYVDPGSRALVDPKRKFQSVGSSLPSGCSETPATQARHARSRPPRYSVWWYRSRQGGLMVVCVVCGVLGW